ncbi:type II toxin-antitoxin system Phd/YefM family antitoxin [Candidatus Peregrinibacteria bacterium]|jgi:PHD/YefM family antitoxin component YafN of YafNO toxin-antitoxin module|nr:type II toxin-antitoxin system Phd/YefM family antitoxin [Candidatus Peregrinibacteria bacterium]MBT4631607.1 type II toxin-antitoxin system Phd/YefM family antitoxin [Candidatus Peregrinibacteria bacterium]MBT5516613.1 type II toxin-antitoxin system Phd/YefM family antitoxin [Candidatus Peregrinibacteria bacterium]MBT5823696.1 type II toxin-antitoxin system Phd/YefM family antitoxin [Candidatus Peregrinibacteria bacterium]
MKHFTTTEARKNLSKIVNEVKYKKVIIAIGRRDEEEVYVIPKPDLDEELPISQINAASPSFDFLDDEPDIYSLNDLKKRYV